MHAADAVGPAYWRAGGGVQAAGTAAALPGANRLLCLRRPRCLPIAPGVPCLVATLLQATMTCSRPWRTAGSMIRLSCTARMGGSTGAAQQTTRVGGSRSSKTAGGVAWFCSSIQRSGRFGGGADRVASGSCGYGSTSDGSRRRAPLNRNQRAPSTLRPRPPSQAPCLPSSTP